MKTSLFIEKAQIIHGFLYDYSETVYSTYGKISIRCAIHGTFQQLANHHLRGSGCPKCHPNARGTTEDFVVRAKEIHSDFYEYKNSLYVGNKKKVDIMCKYHGLFKQTPADHLKGSGCPSCKSNKAREFFSSNTENFLKKAKSVHGNLYDYSNVIYVNSKKNVIINCVEHGSFEQTPNVHLSGSGCRICGRRYCKSETAWLDSLGIPNDRNHRQVRIDNFIVDGYSSETNTVYEFWGCYFHGHPDYFLPNDICEVNGKTFGQLYFDTTKKITKINEAGYSLIDVWAHKLRSGKIEIVPHPKDIK